MWWSWRLRERAAIGSDTSLEERLLHLEKELNKLQPTLKAYIHDLQRWRGKAMDQLVKIEAALRAEQRIDRYRSEIDKQRKSIEMLKAEIERLTRSTITWIEDEEPESDLEPWPRKD